MFFYGILSTASGARGQEFQHFCKKKREENKNNRASLRAVVEEACACVCSALALVQGFVCCPTSPRFRCSAVESKYLSEALFCSYVIKSKRLVPGAV